MDFNSGDNVLAMLGLPDSTPNLPSKVLFIDSGFKYSFFLPRWDQPGHRKKIENVLKPMETSTGLLWEYTDETSPVEPCSRFCYKTNGNFDFPVFKKRRWDQPGLETAVRALFPTCCQPSENPLNRKCSKTNGNLDWIALRVHRWDQPGPNRAEIPSGVPSLDSRGAISAMQSLQCNLCNALYAMQSMQCNAIYAMQCNQCNAIYAMQSTQFNRCNAIYAMQCMQCNHCNAICTLQSMQCNAINAMRSMQCYLCNSIDAMRSMTCNVCNAINAMQSVLCYLCNALYAVQSLQSDLCDAGKVSGSIHIMD